MSVQDLWSLVKHYRSLTIGAPLLCAAVMFLWSAFFAVPTYSATASLEVGDPSGSLTVATLESAVSPLTKQIAARERQGAEVAVSASSDAGSSLQSFVFTATGSDPELCVQAANTSAKEASEEAADLFAELDRIVNEDAAADREGKIEILESLDASDAVEGLLEMNLVPTRRYQYCSFTVLEASSAIGGHRSTASLVLLGFLGGCVLALVGVSAIDYMKRPIKGPNDIAKLGLRSLSFPYPNGRSDYLWANVAFSFGGCPSTVAIVPLTTPSSAAVAEQLKEARGERVFVNRWPTSNGVDSHGVDSRNCTTSVFACDSLKCGVGGAEAAHVSDVTIVAVVAWSDSMDELQETLSELTAASANIVGVAFTRQGQAKYSL